MSKIVLKSKQSSLRRVNMTQFSVFISRWPSGAGLRMTAFPSEAFLNTDGTLSVSSRTTNTAISRMHMPKGREFFGVTKDTNELVEITFE